MRWGVPVLQKSNLEKPLRMYQFLLKYLHRWISLTNGPYVAVLLRVYFLELFTVPCLLKDIEDVLEARYRLVRLIMVQQRDLKQGHQAKYTCS